MRLSPCKTALSLSVLERRLILSNWPVQLRAEGFLGGRFSGTFSRLCPGHRQTGNNTPKLPGCRPPALNPNDSCILLQGEVKSEKKTLRQRNPNDCEKPRWRRVELLDRAFNEADVEKTLTFYEERQSWSPNTILGTKSSPIPSILYERGVRYPHELHRTSQHRASVTSSAITNSLRRAVQLWHLGCVPSAASALIGSREVSSHGRTISISLRSSSAQEAQTHCTCASPSPACFLRWPRPARR